MWSALRLPKGFWLFVKPPFLSACGCCQSGLANPCNGGHSSILVYWPSRCALFLKPPLLGFKSKSGPDPPKFERVKFPLFVSCKGKFMGESPHPVGCVKFRWCRSQNNALGWLLKISGRVSPKIFSLWHFPYLPAPKRFL